MDKMKRMYISACAAFLAAMVMLGGCRRDHTPALPPPPAVTVAQPVSQEVIEWDEYTGHLEAVESVDVRARVSGLIMSAPFEEGTIIKEGETLVEIDVRPFQAELDARIADEARAAAQVSLAEIEFSRLQHLREQSVASLIEYQNAEASLKEAQAVLAGAKAAVEAARLNVEWCRVTAPIGGRISRKVVTPGNLITGGGEQATLLTTIMSIDPIYCYFDADERSVLKYKQLAQQKKRVSARDAEIPCVMALANETGFPHEGVIDFVDNRMDPNTGTMRARGVFQNPDGWLTPGLFARVRIPGSGRYQTLLVPDVAVTTDQNQKALLVVGPESVVQARPIRPGAIFGELRSIESGISADDRVIISGQMQARPGVKVSPREGTISMASFCPMCPGSPATQELPAVTRADGAPAPATARATP